MRRRNSASSMPLAAALALLLLLLVCFFHLAAAARSLPAAAAATTVPRPHRQGAEDDAMATAGVPVFQEAGAASNGDDVSEVMEAEEACEEGSDAAADECLQRRLLRDAHLDYIYTQHKGKP